MRSTNFRLKARLRTLLLQWYSRATSLALQSFDVIEQYLFVSLRAYLFIDLAHHAGGIDHEAGTVPVHRSFVFALSYAASFEQFRAGIGKQVDREAELVAETLMRIHIILAHTDYADSRGVEIGLRRSERFSLNGASGRVVFRIEIHHQPFAGEV